MTPSCEDCWSQAKGQSDPIAAYRALLAEHEDNQPRIVHNGVRVHQGDALALLRTMPDASVHAVVTDPPYGLSEHKPAVLATTLTAWLSGDREQVPDGKGFMGRAWDAFVPPPAVWDECLRVLKPGGHLLCFAGSRTVDLMGLSIRLAGFEMRDEILGLSLAWIQGQGFPKGKSQLKPAHEPILVARRPLAGTMSATMARHGTGGLNIDATRVTVPDRAAYEAKCASVVGLDSNRNGTTYGEWSGARQDSSNDAGRWPANVVLVHHPDCADECEPGCPVAELDAQSGSISKSARTASRDYDKHKDVYQSGALRREGESWGYDDPKGTGASRFYPQFKYQAKAPTKERPAVDGVKHPTVKPLALMRWLVRLVTPPGGGIVLDPFAGSGTTLQAARDEGFSAIGIESHEPYLALIEKRLTGRDPESADQDGAA